METFSFSPFRHSLQLGPEEAFQRSADFLTLLKERRSIREFSARPVDRDIINNCLLAAGTAPSGANKQPWHFAVIESSEMKKKLRSKVEEEELLFYTKRASKAWLRDLEFCGTTFEKPYLEIAPYIIAIFYKTFEVNCESEKARCYYPKESVGIATGMLITALHNSGLATLTHTPSPMGFLNELLDIPPEQFKPFLMLVTGYAAENAKVPVISKKELSEIADFY